MPSGGARNRSGPQPDPNSGRSDRHGRVFEPLPSGGYTGRPPQFPLPPVDLYLSEKEGARVFKVPDPTGTDARRAREAELWRWAWKTPQAAAWALEPWRWHTVAMWVRTAAVCETSDASAADKNSLHRLADQIGMTPAGLRENGWKIAADELAPRRAVAEEPAAADVRGRLTAVPHVAGA